jgi:hypothetical protein
MGSFFFNQKMMKEKKNENGVCFFFGVFIWSKVTMNDTMMILGWEWWMEEEQGCGFNLFDVFYVRESVLCLCVFELNTFFGSN